MEGVGTRKKKIEGKKIVCARARAFCSFNHSAGFARVLSNLFFSSPFFAGRSRVYVYIRARERRDPDIYIYIYFFFSATRPLGIERLISARERGDGSIDMHTYTRDRESRFCAKERMRARERERELWLKK